ncbi:MAG: AMP-binding protein [Acidimicrobiia bacterium]|nr:AMP-binding protein [Acidimicrobiia bacterium]
MLAFNIADLFECVADTVPDREAVVCGDRRLTYAELDERATRLAHALQSGLGIRPGDHVGLQLYDSTEHVEAMLACYKARAVPINVNWRYVADELRQVLGDADAKALFHEPALAPVLRPAVARGEQHETLVTSGSDVRDFGPRSGDDHYVLYTGGTTGLPKGVVWRQEDIFFAVLGGGNPAGPPIERPEEIRRTPVTNRALRLRAFLPPDDPGPDQFVQLSLSPLIHAGGQWSALATLLGGGKVVLYHERHMDMGAVLDLVGRERITSLNMTGDVSAVPLLGALAARPDRYDTSSLRLLGSGATMLSGDVKAELLERIPTVVAISEAVGSSEAPVEAATVTTRSGPRPASLRFNARPETTVLDDALQPVAPGSGRVGRLAVRGRVPLGYHNDPDRSARTFIEIDGVRWTHTGDMATIEADGSIRLLGRGSQCINTGGEKVYPEEVEAVVKTHPRVADALVVGRPDANWGQRVVALVQLVDGAGAGADADADASLDLDELDEHCRPHLAAYKLPRAVVTVERIERSPTGKPDFEWARRSATASEAVGEDA